MKIENCWKFLTRTKVCHLDSLGRKLCIWSFIFVPYLCHHGKKSTVTAPLGCLCRTAPTHGTARKCNGLCEKFCEKKYIWLHFNLPLHLSTNCTCFSLGTSFSSSCNSHLENSSSECSLRSDVTFGFNTVFDGSWSQTSNEATECRVATCRNTAPKSSEKSSWRNLKLQKLCQSNSKWTWSMVNDWLLCFVFLDTVIFHQVPRADHFGDVQDIARWCQIQIYDIHTI